MMPEIRKQEIQHFLSTGELCMESMSLESITDYLTLSRFIPGLLELKDLCECKLMQMIDLQNAVNLLQLSDNFYLSNLKTSILDFISTNI